MTSPLPCLRGLWLPGPLRLALALRLIAFFGAGVFWTSVVAAQAPPQTSTVQRVSPEDSCGVADRALAEGRWAEANENYAACATIHPDSFAVLSNMGVALSHLGRMQDAIGSYNKALALDPRNAKIEFNLSVSLVKDGNYPDAVEHLKHLQLTGDDVRYQELLAFCYYHLQNYQLAARSAEAVYVLHPEDSANALILGSTYTRLGMYDKALPLITQALKAAGSADGHLIMAQTLLGLHMYHPAEEELKQAQAIQPDLPGLHTAFGDVYVGTERVPEAEKEFASALSEDPNDYEANYLLGRLKRFDGDIAAANKYLDAANQLHPNSPDVAFERATIYISQHRYADAVPLLEQVIKAEPDQAQAYLMLSISYQRTGRRADAQREGELYDAKKRQLHERQAAMKQEKQGDTDHVTTQ